jgi:cytochrome c
MILPEWSKYVAAILGAVLLALACGWFGREIYPPQFLARSAYRVAGVDDSVVDLVALRRNWPQALESPADRVRLLDYMRDMRQQLTSNPAGEAGAPATPAVDEVPDFATAIPLASVSDGQQVTQRCQQCHDWEKGGPNKIGPNLYGIIGRARASHAGFSYSSAMMSKGGTWTYDEIFRFLRSPAGYIPGTKMTFMGLPRSKDRLNVLAFMRSWADKPPPLPAPRPAKAVVQATKAVTTSPAKP